MGRLDPRRQRRRVEISYIGIARELRPAPSVGLVIDRRRLAVQRLGLQRRVGRRAPPQRRAGGDDAARRASANRAASTLPRRLAAARSGRAGVTRGSHSGEVIESGLILQPFQQSGELDAHLPMQLVEREGSELLYQPQRDDAVSQLRSINYFERRKIGLNDVHADDRYTLEQGASSTEAKIIKTFITLICE